MSFVLPLAFLFSIVQFSKNYLRDDLSKLNRVGYMKFLEIYLLEVHYSAMLSNLVSKIALLLSVLPRKEVIQPQVLLRLPCYDFTPITNPTFGRWLLTVTSRTSGVAGSHGVTGGVYKARERIHRDILIHDY